MSDDRTGIPSGDNKSVSDDSSTTTGHGGLRDTQRDEIAEIEKLAKDETWKVQAWRQVILVLMVITAVLVTVSTHIFLTLQDEQEFQASLRRIVRTIEGSVEFKLTGIIQATEGLSELLTASALTANESWPFVTLPNFNEYTDGVTTQSSSKFIFYAPVVERSDLPDWNEYSMSKQSLLLSAEALNTSFHSKIYRVEQTNGTIVPETDENYRPMAPLWQVSPEHEDPSIINLNVLSFQGYADLFQTVISSRQTMRGSPDASGLIQMMLPSTTEQPNSTDHQQNISLELISRPLGTIMSPIFEHVSSSSENGRVTGVVVAIFSWDDILQDAIGNGLSDIHCVLTSDCAMDHTYLLKGNDALYVGHGDLHEDSYSNLRRLVTMKGQVSQECPYTLYVYPTQELRMYFKALTPRVFAAIVALAFLIMVVTFCMYERFVELKNLKMIQTAARSNAVVSSLFPSNVRDRLLENDDSHPDQPSAGGGSGQGFAKNRKGNNLLSDIVKSKPIADLFPATTIMFADMVGFTAWSSVREPSQVFFLLETVYRAFDCIARRRRVFKVETVGDCYVAVAGLPEPRKDHAVVMARFAIDCLNIVHRLMKELEVTLGPDTGDLSVRVGLHSGPVTAGVLRGERSRFQLFGDTMNTASRIESNGQQGRIHVSQETATLLLAAGKKHWLKKREDRIIAKGKGELQTYWLDVRSSDNSTDSSGSAVGGPQDDIDVDLDAVEDPGNESNITSHGQEIVQGDRKARLIAWNVDLLSRLLKQIKVRREATIAKQSQGRKGAVQEEIWKTTLQTGALSAAHGNVRDENRKTVLDEVQEIITLPHFDDTAAISLRDLENVVLSENVVSELHMYVEAIASMYHDNAFHNFEHASHVTMSVSKLLSRIIAPTDQDMKNAGKGGERTASILHDHTYGITSDPLTQFACVLSALIHDVDHTGVPNTTLVTEQSPIAVYYKNKSVAEQNSVDLAWGLLMEEEYRELRFAICSDSHTDFCRFRQLVVNSVMATDIMDKDLKSLRNARWEKAFSGTATSTGRGRDNESDAINRKATIVIEHLIQASDVAHTMQHWHVYRKWNERLFQEMCCAYKQGRSSQNPAEFWYKGELGFFDFYIIPLARKLKDCGVFGVSSDEYLNYAIRNRKEWEVKGQEVLAQMIERFDQGK